MSIVTAEEWRELVQFTVAEMGFLKISDHPLPPDDFPLIRVLLRRDNIRVSAGCRPFKGGEWSCLAQFYRPSLVGLKRPGEIIDAIQRVRRRALPLLLKKIETYFRSHLRIEDAPRCRVHILQGQWFRERVFEKGIGNHDVWLELTTVLAVDNRGLALPEPPI